MYSCKCWHWKCQLCVGVWVHLLALKWIHGQSYARRERLMDKKRHTYAPHTHTTHTPYMCTDGTTIRTQRKWSTCVGVCVRAYDWLCLCVFVCVWCTFRLRHLLNTCIPTHWHGTPHRSPSPSPSPSLLVFLSLSLPSHSVVLFLFISLLLSLTLSLSLSLPLYLSPEDINTTFQ